MLAAGCVCRVIGSTIEFGPRRVSGSDHNIGSLYEEVNEIVDSDIAKLSCHQFPGTLTGFQLAYSLRDVGFQEIASK